MGLQSAYVNDRGIHAFIRKMMALPFLPAEEIPDAFNRLERKSRNSPVEELASYVKSTWIDNPIWPPSCWSVYMQAVRTNNDVEGWHLGLNRRAAGKTQLPFYLLVKLLHREAKLTSLHIRLVSERKLKRIQRKMYRQLQTKIFGLWEEYRNGERSAKRLLKAISYLYGPVE